MKLRAASAPGLAAGPGAHVCIRGRCAAALAVGNGPRYDRGRSGRDGHAGVGRAPRSPRRRPINPAKYRFTGLERRQLRAAVSHARIRDCRAQRRPSAPTRRPWTSSLAVGRVNTVGDGDRGGRQGDGHAAAGPRHRRAGTGEHDPTGTDRPAGPNTSATRCATRPASRPFAGTASTSNTRSAGSSTPIETASTW